MSNEFLEMQWRRWAAPTRPGRIGTLLACACVAAACIGASGWHAVADPKFPGGAQTLVALPSIVVLIVAVLHVAGHLGSPETRTVIADLHRSRTPASQYVAAAMLPFAVVLTASTLPPIVAWLLHEAWQLHFGVRLPAPPWVLPTLVSCTLSAPLDVAAAMLLHARLRRTVHVALASIALLPIHVAAVAFFVDLAGLGRQRIGWTLATIAVQLLLLALLFALRGPLLRRCAAIPDPETAPP